MTPDNHPVFQCFYLVPVIPQPIDKTRRSIRITSFIYIHHERTAAIDSGQLLEHGFIPFPYRIIHVLQDKCCFAHNSSRVTFVTLIFLLLSKWYFKKIDLISLLTYFFKVKQSISGAQQNELPIRILLFPAFKCTGTVIEAIF